MIKEEIASAIRRYLLEHPSASDTIEGIMNWWIDVQAMKVSEQEVQAALSELCSQNVLQQKQILNSLPLYSLKI